MAGLLSFLVWLVIMHARTGRCARGGGHQVAVGGRAQEGHRGLPLLCERLDETVHRQSDARELLACQIGVAAHTQLLLLWLLLWLLPPRWRWRAHREQPMPNLGSLRQQVAAG